MTRYHRLVSPGSGATRSLSLSSTMKRQTMTMVMITGSPRNSWMNKKTGAPSTGPSIIRPTPSNTPSTREKAMARAAAIKVFIRPLPMSCHTREKLSSDGLRRGLHLSASNWPLSASLIRPTASRATNTSSVTAVPMRARRRALGPGVS